MELGKRVYDKVFQEIKISPIDFKIVFEELAVLFKRTSFSKTFILRKCENILQIRASTNLEYLATVNIAEASDTADFIVACKFKNISSLIAKSPLVSILVTPTYVEVIQDGKVLTLMTEVFQVCELPVIESIGESINSNKISAALRILLKLSPISNLYKKAVSILLGGDIGQVRFPSVWIEVPSEALHLQVDSASAEVLQSFLSRSSNASMLNVKDYTAISKGMSTLFIPMRENIMLDSIESRTGKFGYVGEFDVKDIAEKVKETLSVVGKADCKVLFFKYAVKLEVKTETLSIIDRYKEEYGELLDEITIRLEFLSTLLLLLGNSIKIYREGDYRCIQGQVKILLSQCS